jgi:hypothetical protein
VPSESTPSWLSPPWPYWRRRPSGCFRGCSSPQVLLLVVDGLVISPYVLGLGTPGDVQVRADVGLGFVFDLPGTRSAWGCSARRRAGAQPLLIRLSRVRARGRCRGHDPKAHRIDVAG